MTESHTNGNGAPAEVPLQRSEEVKDVSSRNSSDIIHIRSEPSSVYFMLSN